MRAVYRLDHLQTYEACKRTHTKLVNGKLVIGQPKLVTGPCAMTKLVTGLRLVCWEAARLHGERRIRTGTGTGTRRLASYALSRMEGVTREAVTVTQGDTLSV